MGAILGALLGRHLAHNEARRTASIADEHEIYHAFVTDPIAALKQGITSDRAMEAAKYLKSVGAMDKNAPALDSHFKAAGESVKDYQKAQEDARAAGADADQKKQALQRAQAPSIGMPSGAGGGLDATTMPQPQLPPPPMSMMGPPMSRMDQGAQPAPTARWLLVAQRDHGVH